jgi:hypothetical protein
MGYLLIVRMVARGPHKSNGSASGGSDMAGPASSGVVGTRRPLRGNLFLFGCPLMLLGIVLGAVGTSLVLRRREALPPLTADVLAVAEQRWNEREPGNYNLDVEIAGRQTGHFHVEVRSGRVNCVTRNGVAPQRRVWDTWTVPGMFDTLQQELDLAAPDGAFGQPGARAVMRAIFDPELGFPRRYERMVMGTPYEVRWDVSHFEILEP